MPHVKKNVIQKKQQKKPNPAIVDLPMQPDINERRELKVIIDAKFVFE